MYRPNGAIEVLGGKELSGGVRVSRTGVFAVQPAMTPKYHTNNNNPSLNYMARLFIPFASDKVRQPFIDSFQQNSDARKLAEVLAASGSSTSAPEGYGYIDFLLQNGAEVLQEKFQVVDVLSDNYVSYFFGRQPPMFQYSGVLINTVQDDWRMAFHLIYNEILRGTKLARRQAVVTLAYDDIFVTGVLTAMQESISAEMEMAIPFSFSLLVKSIDLHTRDFGTTGYNPTVLTDYPYRNMPSVFSSSSGVNVTTKSLINAQSVTYTTTQPKKNSEKSEADQFVISDEEVPTAAEGVTYANDSLYNGVAPADGKIETAKSAKSNSGSDMESALSGPQSIPQG